MQLIYFSFSYICSLVILLLGLNLVFLFSFNLDVELFFHFLSNWSFLIIYFLFGSFLLYYLNWTFSIWVYDQLYLTKNIYKFYTVYLFVMPLMLNISSYNLFYAPLYLFYYKTWDILLFNNLFFLLFNFTVILYFFCLRSLSSYFQLVLYLFLTPFYLSFLVLYYNIFFSFSLLYNLLLVVWYFIFILSIFFIIIIHINR